jgi:hypothetical protein
MEDNIVPKRLYNVRLLHDDLQKQDNASFVASNIKISPSGVLEADRVWTDVEFTTKVFYSGEYYITELGPDEVEDFYSDDPHEHHHGDEE